VERGKKGQEMPGRLGEVSAAEVLRTEITPHRHTPMSIIVAMVGKVGTVL